MILEIFFGAIWLNSSIEGETNPVKIGPGMYHILFNNSFAHLHEYEYGWIGYLELTTFLGVIRKGFQRNQLILCFDAKEENDTEEIIFFTQWIEGLRIERPRYGYREVMDHPADANSTSRGFPVVVGRHKHLMKYGYNDDDWHSSSGVYPIKRIPVVLRIETTIEADLIRMMVRPYVTRVELRPGLYDVWQERNPFDASLPTFWVIRRLRRDGTPGARYGAVPSKFAEMANSYSHVTLCEDICEEDECEKKHLCSSAVTDRVVTVAA